MSGKTERFVLADRRCACFVPEGEVKGLMVLCGGQMERMLPALAAEAPGVLLFFAEADGGRDFTPWPAESVWEGEPFSGGGAEYLRFLTETAVPYLEEKYGAPGEKRAILGYSLGGLFALWALCETSVFGSGASVSGSLWYPGFTEYFRAHMPRREQRVYLSLGDREPFGGPPVMRTVGARTEEIASLLSGSGRDVIFEWNRGGHAKAVENRWKKAVRYCAQGGGNETADII